MDLIALKLANKYTDSNSGSSSKWELVAEKVKGSKEIELPESYSEITLIVESYNSSHCMCYTYDRNIIEDLVAKGKKISCYTRYSNSEILLDYSFSDNKVALDSASATNSTINTGNFYTTVYVR